MDFWVGFYADNTGAPGAPLCSYTVSPTFVDTGTDAFGYSVLRWDVNALPTSCNLGSGGQKWLSVEAVDPNPPNCWFFWMSGSGGDGDFYWGGAPAGYGTDVAMCLDGTTTNNVPLRLLSFSAE
jgi:hypothetical protein